LQARGKGRSDWDWPRSCRSDWDWSRSDRPFSLLCSKGERPARLGLAPVGPTLLPPSSQGGEGPVRLGPAPVGPTRLPSLQQGGRAGPTGTGHCWADPSAFFANKGEKPVRVGPVPVGRTLQPSLKQGGKAGPNGTGHGRADPSALFKARGKGRPDWDWSRSDRPLCLLESKGEGPVGLGLPWSDWAFGRSAFLMARQKRCSPGRGPPPCKSNRERQIKKTQSWSGRTFFQPPFQGHGRCSDPFCLL